MRKEYILKRYGENLGRLFIHEDGYLRLVTRTGVEYSAIFGVDADRVFNVLLEKDPKASKYVQIPIRRYGRIKKEEKNFDVRLSVYSRTYDNNPRLYIHNVAEDTCIDYMKPDQILIQDGLEASDEEPAYLSQSDKSNDLTLGERVQYLREMSGMSIRKAAKKAEVSYNTWLSIEKYPDCNPNLDTLSRICKTLGIPLRDLFS